MSKRRRKYANNDPFWMTARYNSKCPCGVEIKPGQQMFWYPLDKKAVCEKCGRIGEMEIQDDELNRGIHAM